MLHLIDSSLGTVADLDSDLMDLEVVGQRFINIRIVHVDWVHVCLHLHQVERDHLAAKTLRRLIFEEPFLVVRFSIEEEIHLVFFTFDLVSDGLICFKVYRLGCLRAQIDLK